MTAQALGDELADAIENEDIGPKQDPKERNRVLADKYEWDVNDAKKIWCFGPDTSGPNLLVD